MSPREIAISIIETRNQGKKSTQDRALLELASLALKLLVADDAYAEARNKTNADRAGALLRLSEARVNLRRAVEQ